MCEMIEKRAQEIVRSLEQERLEHCYCIKMLDLLRRELQTRQARKEEEVQPERIEFKVTTEAVKSIWDYAKDDQIVFEETKNENREFDLFN